METHCLPCLFLIWKVLAHPPVQTRALSLQVCAICLMSCRDGPLRPCTAINLPLHPRSYLSRTLAAFILTSTEISVYTLFIPFLHLNARVVVGHQQTTEDERKTMKDRFDEMARGMAQSVTRRQALKKFSFRLAGMALACFGLADKAGATKNCLPNGTICKPKGPGSESSCNKCCNGYWTNAFTFVSYCGGFQP